MKLPRAPQRAFTLVELLVALALLTTALGMLAALAAFGFMDRAQQQARLRALESAANVLETARTVPWDQLGDEWGQRQHLSADPLLPEGRIKVEVKNEPGLNTLKRVTVKIDWLVSESRPRLEVELVGFFAQRSEKRGQSP